MSTPGTPFDSLHPLIRQQGVLVVDDSEIQRKSAIAILRRLGVSKIFEAADGEAALAVTRNLFLPPAIVVVDLEMPGMDGIELVQQMAQEGLRPGLLVASGAERAILDSVANMIEALGLPLLDAVTKPLCLEHLSKAFAHFGELSRPASATDAQCEVVVSLEMLTDALNEQRIRPHYQPIICLKNGHVTGFEALARWEAGDGSIVLPCSFIELAEKHELIDNLTLAMLDSVLADLDTWHRRGFYPKIAINVSARSLSNRRFANEVIRRVDDARISPSSLMLEITESALVSDLAAALGTLGRLRLKGFGLSIDDYGTGFSSMQQLSRLPFTELKIDRSFVHHAHDKWNLRAMLQSAVEMGQRLGLATVAEGVEAREDLRLLRSIGCKYAQGYLFAAPMPPSTIGAWLLQESTRIRSLCQA